MTVASIFIINYYINTSDSTRLARSYVWVGNDGEPWSESLTLATSEAIYDGGFINFDRPLRGRYVVLRRDEPSLSGNNFYTVNEIKVYGITNLL